MRLIEFYRDEALVADVKKPDWNQFLEGDEKKLGLSKDVVRKLREMNPALKDGSSTEDFLKNVRSQVKSGPTSPAVARAPGAASPVGVKTGPLTPHAAPTAGDLLTAVAALKLAHDQENLKLDEEMKRLVAQQRANKDTTCAKLLDAVLDIDPGLTSPKSNFVLAQEKKFLDGVGFSMEKLVERQRSRPVKK